jgi:RNA polymerase sigma-70 factor (ECF subfamily)
MDKIEFANQIDALKNRLYRIAYLYLGNEQGAIEVVDETVYKALRSLSKLREEQFFNTWVTRILINECKKELKRLSKVYIMEDLSEQIEENTYDTLPLKEAIHRLPENLKAIIILRYFSDYTLAETANALQIPQGTVVTRQRKALKLLRLELEED